MNKLLTPDNAKNIFTSSSSTHDLMANGGAQYVSTGTTKDADPSRAPVWYSTATMKDHNDRYTELSYDYDTEISYGDKDFVDSKQAKRMVNQADAEYALVYNNKAYTR